MNLYSMCGHCAIGGAGTARPPQAPTHPAQPHVVAWLLTTNSHFVLFPSTAGQEPLHSAMDAAEFKVRGQEMVEYICSYLEDVGSRRVTSTVEPGYLRPLLPKEAPQEPEDWDQILADVDSKIMPGVRLPSPPSLLTFDTPSTDSRGKYPQQSRSFHSRADVSAGASLPGCRSHTGNTRGSTRTSRPGTRTPPSWATCCRTPSAASASPGCVTLIPF